MHYQRLAYDDQDSAERMHDDCAACGEEIALPKPRTGAAATEPAPAPAPTLEFETYTRADHLPEIAVSDAAAHLAAGLHLHLD